mgnify:CR=1 FL=1
MNDTITLNKPTLDLMKFIDECKALGFKNNDSLESMCFDEAEVWFATYDNKNIVGLSGMHKFKDGWRALFRGAQLYPIPGGLSKNHMNCWMFYYHLPFVIDFVHPSPIYITTNIDNDASGYMTRLDKLYHILQQKGIVDHISTEHLRGVNQNIWRLNVNVYEEVRSNADNRILR